MNQYVFRYAEESDAALVLYFIKELAKYEKMLDEVIATEETTVYRVTGDTLTRLAE